jgi:hypothetical protein
LLECQAAKNSGGLKWACHSVLRHDMFSSSSLADGVPVEEDIHARTDRPGDSSVIVSCDGLVDLAPLFMLEQQIEFCDTDVLLLS